MRNLMIITTLAVLLAGCTPPEVKEPEQEIIPLSIPLPS